MPITRRDFLNGTALTIAAGLTPAAQIAAQPQRYPPALTGLRGQHDGSFETAHALAREGATLPARERADRRNATTWSWSAAASAGSRPPGSTAARGPHARILILDNHDDFGGHAKRNEFMLDGRRIIGYGGSQSLQSPNTLYGAERQGPAARTRRRHPPLRNRLRAHALPVARPVARAVLCARSVRTRRAGAGRGAQRERRR